MTNEFSGAVFVDDPHKPANVFELMPIEWPTRALDIRSAKGKIVATQDNNDELLALKDDIKLLKAQYEYLNLIVQRIVSNRDDESYAISNDSDKNY